MELARAAKETWDRFEALVGLIAAFMLAFGPVVLFGGVALFAAFLAEWQVAQIALLGFAITCPMAVWLAKMSESGLSDFFQSAGYHYTKPFALVVASKLPTLPLFARVPLAIWWFAHFVGGTLLVQCSSWLEKEQFLVVPFSEGIPSIIFGYVFHFATNIFLILAITSLFGMGSVAKRVWRKRFVYDFVFTLPLVVRMFL